MPAPTYPAARAAAERIETQFARRIAAAPNVSDVLRPDAIAIEEIISAAFWASLRQEEGRAPKISLALLPPEQAVQPLTFVPRLPLVPESIAKLAPAVEGPGIHLGVWPYERKLSVWGVTRSVPPFCFVLEVVSPGLLVVKYRRRDPAAKFANVATLEGSDVKFVDQQDAMVVDSPPLASLLAFYSSAGRQESETVLVRMAATMRAHKRGGLLLVVPAESDDWRMSVVQPIPYNVTPPFSEISTLPPGSPALRESINALAGLTAVDGATVISDRYDLLAFGAKIIKRKGTKRVEQVVLTEPIQGTTSSIVEFAQLGGTRHLSAVQFVQDQRDSIAMVASQDGHFTVFAWSPVQDMVHGHRLESLLM